MSMCIIWVIYKLYMYIHMYNYVYTHNTYTTMYMSIFNEHIYMQPWMETKICMNSEKVIIIITMIIDNECTRILHMFIWMKSKQNSGYSVYLCSKDVLFSRPMSRDHSPPQTYVYVERYHYLYCIFLYRLCK